VGAIGWIEVLLGLLCGSVGDQERLNGKVGMDEVG
jgi:hypothetical protein